MLQDYGIQKIMEVLPHRYPFLMVDRVVELVPDDRIVAIKNVSISEPFFRGHFPGRPIMPGVMILEAMAQTGAILAYESSFPAAQRHLLYFVAIDKVKFRKPVLPGDVLTSEMRILKQRTRMMKMTGFATVDNRKVAEAEFLAAVGEDA